MSEKIKNKKVTETKEIYLEEDVNKYILFWLGNELYGSPLLQAREVVEYQNPKTIPNTTAHFLGVINVRGEIIGLIDLRARFGLEKGEKGKSPLIIFETQTSPVAISIDRLESVVGIGKEQIEDNPNIVSRIPQEYLLGIGHYDDRLVTLLDLKKILSEEDFIILNSVAQAAT